MKQEEPTITRAQYRAMLIAKIKGDAAEIVKDGWAAVPTDEALSKTILEELVANTENIPDSTAKTLFFLLVIFEMRRLQDVAQSRMQ